MKKQQEQYQFAKCFRLTVKTVLFTMLLLLTSCITQKEVEYLQDKSSSINEFNEAEIADYRLKSNDELFIQVNSLDDPTVNVFSSASSQQSSSVMSIQPYGASLMSYTIDKEGYLLFPVIGNIHVENKTISQVTEMMRDSLISILSQPIVTVKLVNRYVSVLGEVRNAGHFPYAQEKLTIFDALGLAGDITEYGNRNEVILARNENGKNIRVVLNLGTSGVLASKYYYMRPNDLVYVKPLKKKYWGMRQFPFSIILASISTALLIYTVVK